MLKFDKYIAAGRSRMYRTLNRRIGIGLRLQYRWCAMKSRWSKPAS